MSWVTEEKWHSVQVQPVEDLIEHRDFGCPCAPKVLELGSTCDHDGPKLMVRKLVTHHAMDGRP